MAFVEEDRMDVPGGVGLRTELSLRGLRFAKERSLLHDRTDGRTPSILFGRTEAGRHGNFHPASDESICAKADWAKRLQKVHTAYKRSRARADWQWKELDCAYSSDALLMNIFCYPGVTADAAVKSLLGVDATAAPEFGYKPRTPLQANRTDNTEIDMKLGNLLVEAKLTESDFQSAKPGLVSRYRDFEMVFEAERLPMREGKHAGYQLIRNILAAHATESCFCVLCDARRPDLIEQWFRVLCAVRSCELRSKLKILTWQELASALPGDLQHFLRTKYGILVSYGLRK
jgi:hypothetical protein